MNNTIAARRLRSAMAESMGGDPSRLVIPGTTAVADGARQGSSRVACYQFGVHTMLFCDPEVLTRAAELDGPMATPDVAFREWAAAAGATILGQSVMKTAAPNGLTLPTSQHPSRLLRWSNANDLALMQAFVDASETDDLEEAEVAMDDLDDLAVAAFEPGGAMGAYASSRPFDEEVWLGDIGIVTAPGVRRLGFGAAATSTLITDVLAPAGIEPLYRCDPINAGSDRLSASLGFEPALSLILVELPG